MEYQSIKNSSAAAFSRIGFCTFFESLGGILKGSLFSSHGLGACEVGGRRRKYLAIQRILSVDSPRSRRTQSP